MSKTHIKTIAFLSLLAGCLAGLYASLPFLIQSVAFHHLHGRGKTLETIALPPAHVGIDFIRFENVSLDPDNINTIKELTFLFTPLGLVQGAFNKVIIQGADIIASTGTDNTLTLDGWLGTRGIERFLGLRIKSLHLRDAEITILTEEYGGITLYMDMTASLTSQPHEKPLYEFQSRFETQQRYLSLSGTGSGSLSKDFINAETQFERGKVSIPDLSIDMTRLSGWGRAAYSRDGLSLFSELRSGGMRLGSLPWQNASMTYKYENNLSEIFLSAHSLGLEGLELALTTQGDTPSTRIHTPTQSLWNEYIALNKIEGEELEALVGLLSRLNTEIELE
ncbi:MAG: hypothetical protein CL570_01240 [Alphaproteobacteria bacterium]|nr:hypothetical protein [Alphaproteobacteria bacterium]|tara:strand:- start:71328 stop:72335 length:1008 start_codon:yes stop_codon:yes gene_type:complete